MDAISDERTVDIKKRPDSISHHPSAVFAFNYVPTDTLAKSLVGIGENVTINEFDSDGSDTVGLGLLLRQRPRIGSAPLKTDGETSADAAKRIAPLIEGGVLPIQGPPGAGKTYTAARMICALVDDGAKVGITANSHKVIRNLLDEVVRAAEESGTKLIAIQKTREKEDNLDRIHFAKENKDIFNALKGGYQVAGGTGMAMGAPGSAELG